MLVCFGHLRWRLLRRNGNERVNIKKGPLNSFVQRGSNLVGEEKMRRTTINEAMKGRDAVNKDVCCLIYTEGLPFNLVKSPFFKNALESVENYSRSYQLPRYNQARVIYL